MKIEVGAAEPASAVPAAGRPDPLRNKRPRGLRTQARIRDEALRLFFHQGFSTTTMREICTASGVSSAAFYKHYASKDDLLLSIVVDTFTRLESSVRDAIASSEDSPTAHLVGLVRVMTVWHCEHPHEARVANREVQELPEPMLTTVHQHWRRLRGLTEDIVRRGLEEGEFEVAGAAADARHIAVAVLGFVRSLSAWQDQMRHMSTVELAEFIVSFVTRMVGARATN